MGPRQIIAWSGSTKKPMEMTLTPYAASGSTSFPSGEEGFAPKSPIIRGMLGP